MRLTPLVTSLALISLLLSCTSYDQNTIDYKSAQPGKNLAVPPDLAQISNDPRFHRIGNQGLVSVQDIEEARANNAMQNPTIAPNQMGNMQIMRDGNARWLLVQHSPEELWPMIREFWLESGFILTMDNPQIGIMETDWAENRAKIPQDIIRKTLGNLFDSLYSSGERDRFRTRIERTENGATEVFITHKGMVEEDTRDKTSTVWIPAPNNPELETEFLRRLMVRLGLREKQSKSIVASFNTNTSPASSTTQQASLSEKNGQPVVVYRVQNEDRAWRILGNTLDRSGFTVEDRNRSTGLYYVRYVHADDPSKESSGFFSALFGTSNAKNVERYQIHLATHDGSSLISVRNEDGTAASNDLAQRILKIIATSLN